MANERCRCGLNVAATLAHDDPSVGACLGLAATDPPPLWSIPVASVDSARLAALVSALQQIVDLPGECQDEASGIARRALKAALR